MPTIYHIVEPEAPQWRRYPLASPRRDRQLAGTERHIEQSDVEVRLGNFTSSSVRVRIGREDTKFFGGSCYTRIYVVDAETRRVVKSVVPTFTSRSWTSAFRYDCLAEFTLTLPQSFDARRPVYLVLRNRDGSEVARGGAFSLKRAAEGGERAVVGDDRGAFEKLGDGVGSVAQFTEDQLNKLIWAGGIAASIVLISITRR